VSKVVFSSNAGLPASGSSQLGDRWDFMLELIFVVLVILWILGYFGPVRIPQIPKTGNMIHVLLFIVLILVIVRLLK
jgi:hypothetical protein